ncbi:DUF1344 domain-containing protein [Mangrovicella endophytica]|uniref:DUF1344 domain-containing protein n=1 Tax=Mangrovicella endophytica TaxID=2066697 RepID=UPI0012FFF3A0|nr:DUF1344 domain-containing protein [Mangrovicella endophytica]
MKRLVVSATVLSALLVSGGAFAATATGTVKAMDVSKHTVTLKNGETFTVAPSVKLSTLKAGEKVSITYTKSGTAMSASKIMAAK